MNPVIQFVPQLKKNLKKLLRKLLKNMFGDSSLEYKAPKWYYDIRSDVEYHA